MSAWPIANKVVQRNRPQPSYTQVVDEVVLTAAGSDVAKLRVADADFLWTASIAVSSGTFRCRINCLAENRYLDNAKVRSENFWGLFGTSSAAKGAGWHPPKFLPKNAEVQFELEDTSDSGNTVALYLLGEKAVTCGGEGTEAKCATRNCKCDRARWGEGRGLFIHGTPSGSQTSDPATNKNGFLIEASKSHQNSIKLLDHSHFRCIVINSFATSDSWKGTFEYSDFRDDRRRKAMSAKARSRAWTGSNISPGVMSSPYVGRKGSTVTFDLDDLSAALNRIHIAMIGELVDDRLVEQSA